MQKEKLFFPITILCIVAAFVFGFIYYYKNIQPIKSVLSKKDIVCGDMPLIEAIELARGSDCMDAGQLNEDLYVCSPDGKRIDISMDVTGEKEDICAASCYIYTDTKDTYLQWMCRGLLE